jgi:hypothetical protein
MSLKAMGRRKITLATATALASAPLALMEALGTHGTVSSRQHWQLTAVTTLAVLQLAGPCVANEEGISLDEALVDLGRLFDRPDRAPWYREHDPQGDVGSAEAERRIGRPPLTAASVSGSLVQAGSRRGLIIASCLVPAVRRLQLERSMV